MIPSTTAAAPRSGAGRFTDLALLLLLATLWGGSYSFIKVGVETIPPVTLIAARTLLAGAILLALSVASTALAFVIYFRLIARLGSLATTSVAYLRVPTGVLIGMVFLGESLAPTAWTGLVLIVAGVLAMTLPARKRPAAA